MRLALPDRSRPGVWLSAAAHAGLIAAGLVTLTAQRLPDAQEGIPVEIVSDSLLSEITRGETTAAKVQPTPSPRVERQAETRVERDPGEAKRDVPAPPKRPVEAKVADEESEPAPAPPKRTADLRPAEPPPPAPPSRPDVAAEAAKARAEAAKEAARREEIKLAQREEAAELARAEKADAEARAKAAAAAKARQESDAKAKAEAKAREAEAQAKADAKAKQEADAKAKAEADAKAKALAQAKAKAEEAKARRQAEAADKFSPGDIRQLLASKEPAQSSGATGRDIQRTASLGTATGAAQRLNPSQRDQITGLIREQLIRCWQPPVAVQSAAKPPTAVVRLAIKQDGSLLTEPTVTNASADPLFRPVADSALRATRRCAPLKIPDRFAPFYQDWKDLVVDFDPKEMG